MKAIKRGFILCLIVIFVVPYNLGLAAGERNISLNLRNIDIIEALKFLAMKAGIGIVPTQKVTGRVTLTVENAPIHDVFDIMLRSNNLAYDKRGNIYNIMTEAEYRALFGKRFSDTRVVKVFRLQYAIPDQAFTLLDTVKSEIGRLLVDSESGTVLIMDTPEKIKEAQEVLTAMENRSSIKIFPLQYARATEVAEQLKSQLDLKKVGSIKADDRANQVIVQTLPDRMKDIEGLIAGLDKKTKQVLIDAKIVQVRLSDQRDAGIEWEGLFRLGRQFGMTYLGSYPFSAVQSATTAWASREQFLNNTMSGSVGAYPFSGTTSDFDLSSKVTAGEEMHVGVVSGRSDFDVIIKYLQTLGKTKILSNPTLAAVNNREATIHIGERRAYVTTTTTASSSTTTTAEEVTYVDIGIKLSMTPTINDQGFVTIKIKPEVSSVIGYVNTSSGNQIPIIDTSIAETVVMAKDGATILLGGLGKEEKTETTEQIPFLGRIPLLGLLFRSSTKSTTRTELVIMITPTIFEGEMLVTAQDRSIERYNIKSTKKFDVFREEVPLAEARGASKETVEEKLTPKGFKQYQYN